MDYEGTYRKYLEDSAEAPDQAWESEPKNSETDEQPKDEPLEATTREKFKNAKPKVALQKINQKQKKFDISFHDLLDTSIRPAPLIERNLAYSLPIPSNPEYRSYSTVERTKLLYQYHSRISELKTRIAKVFLTHPPYSKPISPSGKGALNKDQVRDNDEFDFDEIPSQGFYTSRAGRQVKRKIYTELEVDNDFDLTLSAKKNKVTDSDVKVTLETPLVIDENENKQLKTPTAKPKKDNTPKRTFSAGSKKMTRSEAMFDKLMENDVKRKQEENEMANFEKSISNLDFLEQIESPVKEVPEEEFIRKRVTPPSYAAATKKKGGRAKKKLVQEEKSEAGPSSPVLGNFAKEFKSLNITRRPAKPKQDASEVELSGSPEPKQLCPICDKLFSQREIENHASTCGDDPPPSAVRNNTTVTCQLCDKFFLVAEAYESHKQQCAGDLVNSM